MRLAAWSSASCIGFALIALARPARACGVSTVDGLSACSLQEHEEETRSRWLVGASGVYTSMAILFSGNLRSDETRGSVVASLVYQPSRRLTLQKTMENVF